MNETSALGTGHLPKYADDILLHADGIMSMFRIADGRVSYAARYVETERLKANIAAASNLFISKPSRDR